MLMIVTHTLRMYIPIANLVKSGDLCSANRWQYEQERTGAKLSYLRSREPSLVDTIRLQYCRQLFVQPEVYYHAQSIARIIVASMLMSLELQLEREGENNLQY